MHRQAASITEIALGVQGTERTGTNAENQLLQLKSKKMDKRTWSLEDHLCKYCGGRVLRCVSGNGATPGGSPTYKCSLCGVEKSGIHPNVICWCGFSHRMNHNSTAYICQSFDVLKDRPELAEAFGACGCDPKRGEVGVLLESDFRRILKGATGQ